MTRRPVLHVGSGGNELQPQLPALGRDIVSDGARARRRIRAMWSGTALSSQANFSPVPGTLYGVYDQISRPDEKATSNYGSLEAEYQVSDALEIPARSAPRRATARHRPRTCPRRTRDRTAARAGSSMASAARRTSTSARPTTRHRSRTARRSTSAGSSAPRTWTSRTRKTGPRSMPTSPWTRRLDRLKFGVRYSEHSRESLNTSPRARSTARRPEAVANWIRRTIRRPSRTIRPTSTLSAGRFPRTSGTGRRRSSRNTTGEGFVNRDPVLRADAALLLQVEEKNAAAYVQADFRGSNWSGNIGLRYVRTDEKIVIFDQPSRRIRTPSRARSSGPTSGIPVETRTTTGCRAQT